MLDEASYDSAELLSFNCLFERFSKEYDCFTQHFLFDENYKRGLDCCSERNVSRHLKLRHSSE